MSLLLDETTVTPSSRPGPSSQMLVRTDGDFKSPQSMSTEGPAMAEPISLIRCGICQDSLLLVANPLEASLLPSASSKRQRYGLRFLCPGRHMYCLDCSSTYIKVRLQEAGSNPFPIPCPECPRDAKWQIDDGTARKLLPKELLDVWYSKRLLASISDSMLYCPNPKCSEAIDTSDIVLDVDHTQCPACRAEICLKCRTLWHLGLSCEDAKSPLRGSEALHRLATRNQWRRCPKCRALVERVEGCNHMTCLCGAQFCFACGADYAFGGCSLDGGCDGEWREGTDWEGELAQEAAAGEDGSEEGGKQRNILSRLRNIQWSTALPTLKASETVRRPRASSWSKTRATPPSPPQSRADPMTEMPTSPKLSLALRRLRMSEDFKRTPKVDLNEVPEHWRLSRNWVLVPRDSDFEDIPDASALVPPSSTRRNRRSAPPVIITDHSDAPQTSGPLSPRGRLDIPANRMKPLPPLPPSRQASKVDEN